MKTKATFIFFILMLIPVLSYSQKSFQTLKGVVLDEKLRKPMPGATVILTSINPIKGAKTDKNGWFRFDSIPVGRHEIKCRFIGYMDNIIQDINVISGKESDLTVLMVESTFLKKEVEVTAEKPFNLANNDLTISNVVNMKPDIINRFAGSKSDPNRMAANVAGCAGNDSRRNDIIVRGNSPLGVLWRIEGADVPNPNHFAISGTGGGVFSIINNNMLSNCDFITGAFPAEYGNRTAGVFDLHLRNGNADKSEHTFQAGLNGLEFMSEGPLPTGNRGSYVAAFRIVSLEPVKKLGFDLSVNAIPEYLDGSFKLNLPTKSFGNFSIWGLYGYSRTDSDDSEDVTEWAPKQREDDNHLKSSMYAVGIDNTHFFGENTYGKLFINNSASMIFSNNNYVYEDKSRLPSESYKGIEGTASISYQINHKINSQHFIKAGVSFKYMYFNDFYEELNDFDIMETRMDMQGNANLYSAFCHWQWRPTDLLELNTGIYYQFFSLNNHYAIEPRFAARYQLDDTRSINLAYGMHSQTHPLLYYFFLYAHRNNKFEATNYNMDFTRAHHFTIGYDELMFKDFHFKASAFYQYLYDVPTSLQIGKEYYSFVNLGADFSFDGEDSVFNVGKSHNYGLELTFEKNFTNNYYFLITATLLRSDYIDGNNIKRSTAFDLGHVLNILGGMEFKLDDANKYTLSVDAKVSHIGGRKVIPIDVAKSIIEKEKVRDYSRAYEETLKDYFQIDLKVGFNINCEKSTHNFFIAVDNILNTKNPYKQDWDEVNQRIKSKYQLGLFPYLGYRINF